MSVHTGLPEIVEKLNKELPFLSKRYKVKSLGVFGSYVRRAQRADSDIDILVAFSEIPSLLKFIELENYLTDILKIQVDLVMQDALKPRIGQRILQEVVSI